MKPANFAPVYCAIYPGLAEIARKHGYALAIHGSLARDADLICIPWVDAPSDPVAVISEMTTTYAIRQIGEPEAKKHGRVAYTISIAFGECALDLSFMPLVPVAVTLGDHEIVHKGSGKVHRRVRSGEPLVLDSWEERECSVRPVSREGGA